MRHTLFPVSVYHGHVPDNNLLKKLLIPYIEETKDSNEIPTDWMTDKVNTSFSNMEIEKGLTSDTRGEELISQYMKVLDDFFDQPYSMKISWPGIWYNYYVDGEWQEQHNHLSSPSFTNVCHFSCIHFLSFDKENHNSVTFIDPLMNIRCHSLEFKNHEYYAKSGLYVTEGDFLMFPSYLEHEVKKGKPTPDYPRITMSFNVEVVEYGE
tara:strand:+ start:109 stop:735 length:627 start_codon:yes stop_codon:yes gene_type:complete